MKIFLYTLIPLRGTWVSANVYRISKNLPEFITEVEWDRKADDYKDDNTSVMYELADLGKIHKSFRHGHTFTGKENIRILKID